MPLSAENLSPEAETRERPPDLTLAVRVDTVGEALEVVTHALEDFLRLHQVILAAGAGGAQRRRMEAPSA